MLLAQINPAINKSNSVEILHTFVTARSEQIPRLRHSYGIHHPPPPRVRGVVRCVWSGDPVIHPVASVIVIADPSSLLPHRLIKPIASAAAPVCGGPPGTEPSSQAAARAGRAGEPHAPRALTDASLGGGGGVRER